MYYGNWDWNEMDDDDKDLDLDELMSIIYDGDRDPLSVSEDHPLEEAARVADAILNGAADPERSLEFYIDNGGNQWVIRDDSDRTDAVREIMEMQAGDNERDIIIGQLLYGWETSEDLVRKFCPDYYRPEKDYRKAYLLGRDPDGYLNDDGSPEYYDLGYVLCKTREDYNDYWKGSLTATNIDRDPAEKVAVFLDGLAAAIGNEENSCLIIERNTGCSDGEWETLELENGRADGWVLESILKDFAEKRPDDLQELAAAARKKDSCLFDCIRDCLPESEVLKVSGFRDENGRM